MRLLASGDLGGIIENRAIMTMLSHIASPIPKRQQDRSRLRPARLLN
jgi:hypothetical protein